MKEPLAILHCPPMRRLIGTFMGGGLGVWLVWAALAHPPASIFGRIALLCAGAGLVYLGLRLWQATSTRLLLSEDALTEESGRLLFRLEDVQSVDRGAFAMKPSGGFTVRLSRPMPMAWAPGLWWRFGSRVGVGGASSAPAGRALADLISMYLAER